MNRQDNVLLLTHSYPPMLNAAAGRPFYFSKYLAEFGYCPIVVTRHPLGHHALDSSRLQELPREVQIIRIQGPQTIDIRALLRRRFSFLRRVQRGLGFADHALADIISSLALRLIPGQWDQSHWEAVLAARGLQLVEEYRPAAIWATGPKFSTLRAAARLSQRTGTPLIADYRDPWTYGLLWRPSSERAAIRQREAERQVLDTAAAVVFVTPQTEKRMAQRYPQFAHKFRTIVNGFEPRTARATYRPDRDCLTIKYVGTIRRWRIGEAFLRGVELALETVPEMRESLRIRLIGSVLDSEMQELNFPKPLGIEPPVNYDQSRVEMETADALLLLQPLEGDAADVISGKLFDYLASGRPILGVVNPKGGDAWLLRQSPDGIVVKYNNAQYVANALISFYKRWRQRQLNGTANQPQLEVFERKKLTGHLAEQIREVSMRASTRGGSYRQRRSGPAEIEA